MKISNFSNLIFFILVFLNFYSPLRILSYGKDSDNNSNWVESTNTNEKIRWEPFLEKQDPKQNKEVYKISNNKIFNIKPIIRSTGKSVTVNGYPYPNLSLYVPNGFLTDQDRYLTMNFRGIGRVRHCKTEKLISDNCSDAIFDIDYSLIKSNDFTLDLNLTTTSLSDRGTDFGEGISMGFKTAFKEFKEYSFAFGGENIIHFDEHIDLGRNLYLVGSKAYILNSEEKPAILFLTGGLGSDFYGYKGNGFLGKINCFDSKNITGEGSDKCQVGPIFATSLAFNDRLSIGTEWFGYGFAAGISARPFFDMPVSFSLSVTDFLGNFPDYISETCKFSTCKPRLLGSVSISF